MNRIIKDHQEHPKELEINPSLRHYLEAFLVRLALALFARLTLDCASALGGHLGRIIGPRLGVSRRAKQNLRRAFPEHSEQKIQKIVAAMWENLGRTVGEYPHLGKIDCYANDERVEVLGAENIDRLNEDGKPGFFFSGHLANWELLPLAAIQRGLNVAQIYRRANNPLVDRLIQGVRNQDRGHHIGKGIAGAREMIGELRSGGHIAMLVDQKLNEGIPVPFFGRDAMTAPALAQLARRFDCPIVPARIERLEGARFRVTIFPPLEPPITHNAAADTFYTMALVTQLIEGWIRDRPEQWTWIHHRWPD